MDGQPDGRASLDAVKQHLAVYYSSGSEWPQRMKRAGRAGTITIEIFGQKLVTRQPGSGASPRRQSLPSRLGETGGSRSRAHA
nr:hypothetical protein [Bradyrhizobium sp. 132]